MEKTQVMRILDKEHIDYEVCTYEGVVAGLDVARVLNISPASLYKTLVTISKNQNIYVFLVSVDNELDLKKCAQVVNEKSIDLLPNKLLYSTVGYIHGGTSPIGMKKKFKTIIDISAKDKNLIHISGGKIGVQIALNPADLKKVVDYTFADIKKS